MSRKRMICLLSLMLTILASCNTSACNDVNELPEIDSLDIILHYTGFTVRYDTLNRIPVWVAYELSSEETEGESGRESRFTTDNNFKWPQATTKDYSKSGYDRGHMAPAADMKWSPEAMKDCFHLTNICPQSPNLNRRDWKMLEERCRDWARQFGSILIVCGPLVESDSLGTIGNGVRVPDAFFKAVATKKDSSFQGIGFIFNNTDEQQHIWTRTVSIDSIEVRSGLNLFYGMSEEAEKDFDTIFWGR